VFVVVVVVALVVGVAVAVAAVDIIWGGGGSGVAICALVNCILKNDATVGSGMGFTQSVRAHVEGYSSLFLTGDV
jgi:hypothetical protein